MLIADLITVVVYFVKDFPDFLMNNKKNPQSYEIFEPFYLEIKIIGKFRI